MPPSGIACDGASVACACACCVAPGRQENEPCPWWRVLAKNSSIESSAEGFRDPDMWDEVSPPISAAIGGRAAMSRCRSSIAARRMVSSGRSRSRSQSESISDMTTTALATGRCIAAARPVGMATHTAIGTEWLSRRDFPDAVDAPEYSRLRQGASSSPWPSSTRPNSTASLREPHCHDVQRMSALQLPARISPSPIAPPVL
eukprot:CAMPEP_0180147364 /NCGR_PEP_ID=MMETSP0986-20121125/19224_1 /TAXON_ID=697907 /ORGANISM="non described non described, Strain CCMP2293" /LENGTH=201 /DNA_ID=CAMNT_0022092923 /DNA_START=197 /DNA_END=802 /DNA_ORIENTATION=+